MADCDQQHLLQLLTQKHIFAGFHYLSHLPPSASMPNRQKLHDDLQLIIVTAKGLTANINHTLAEGDYPKALLQLQKARSLVPDFPNIQTDIDFITASISTMEKNITEAKQLAAKGQRQKVHAILKNVQDIDKNNDAIKDVEKILCRRLRKKSITTVLVMTLTIMIPLVYFIFEQKTLQQAHDLWGKADVYIGRRQYKQAEVVIAQMDSRLRFVRILGQSEKIQLLSIAANMTQSTLFVQGKESHANGHHLKESGTERYVQSLLTKAEKKSGQEEFDGAIALYNDALKFSEANIYVDTETIEQITIKRDVAVQALAKKTMMVATQTLHGMIDTADRFFRNDNWQQAATAYHQALNYARENNLVGSSKMALVERGYTTAVMNNNIEDAEIALNQNRYNDAVSSFQKCLSFMEEEHLQNEHLYASITAKLKVIKEKQILLTLSKLVEQGDQFFRQSEFERSINNYHAGITLIKTDREGILGKKAALIRKKIEQKIVKAEEKNLVLTQTQHLVATYKKILRHSFNLSRNIHFERPEIVFRGNKDNHLVYSVSAFGVKSISSSLVKYEIDYKFNLHTGQWNVNDIRLEV